MLGLAALTWLAWALLHHPKIPHPGTLSLHDTVSVLQLVFASVAGAGALVALIVAYRRQKVAEADSAHDRTRVFNERFTAIAGQLGDDKPAIRLAGVHAMAGLADDWKANRQTCVNVLCAYLRLPYEHDPGEQAPAAEGLAFRASREVRHTAIRVLTAHLQDDAAVSWQRLNFDFTGVVFDGGSFDGAKFSGGMVNFGGADFSGGTVYFRGATFSGGTVYFRGATFSGSTVYFTDTAFSGGTVYFQGAKFSGGTVNFSAATFSDDSTVNFRDAVFSGGTVYFQGAKFSGGTVNFSLTTFSDDGTLDFSGANLSDGRIQFGSTKFSNGAVYFRSTEFSGGTVNFGFSKFSGATVNFSDARFSGGAVNFRSAEFSGGTVNLSHASDWSDPPIFDSPVSPAVELPAAHHRRSRPES